jgi:hypothetical protein
MQATCNELIVRLNFVEAQRLPRGCVIFVHGDRFGEARLVDTHISTKIREFLASSEISSRAITFCDEGISKLVVLPSSISFRRRRL